jgi:hypothetical protein
MDFEHVVIFVLFRKLIFGGRLECLASRVGRITAFALLQLELINAAYVAVP